MPRDRHFLSPFDFDFAVLSLNCVSILFPLNHGYMSAFAPGDVTGASMHLSLSLSLSPASWSVCENQEKPQTTTTDRRPSLAHTHTFSLLLFDLSFTPDSMILFKEQAFCLPVVSRAFVAPAFSGKHAFDCYSSFFVFFSNDHLIMNHERKRFLWT
jgi:hypothetical protein